MKDEEGVSPMVVFGGQYLEVEFVKTLLENEGIETFIYDENTGQLAPWYTSPGGANAVKIVVSSKDYELAKKIIDEYEKKLLSE